MSFDSATHAMHAVNSLGTNHPNRLMLMRIRIEAWPASPVFEFTCSMSPCDEAKHASLREEAKRLVSNFFVDVSAPVITLDCPLGIFDFNAAADARDALAARNGLHAVPDK